MEGENVYYRLTYPTVSCLGETGMTPARLVRPTVGLIPTTELVLEGHRIDPSLSVPNDTVTMFVATDIADPVLEPHGSRVATYGFCIN
ncbi:hypothetical protein HanRHA438_Chr15g0693441 [Helianthus annuus]|nr:hypothetical protein HanRHA438_Chr15g0693441 [Helianthus annuus]